MVSMMDIKQIELYYNYVAYSPAGNVVLPKGVYNVIGLDGMSRWAKLHNIHTGLIYTVSNEDIYKNAITA